MKPECQFIPLRDEELSQSDCNFLLNCWVQANKIVSRPQFSEPVNQYRTYLFLYRLIWVARDHIERGFHYTEADNYLTGILAGTELKELDKNTFLNKLDTILDSVDFEQLYKDLPSGTDPQLHAINMNRLLPNPKPMGQPTGFSTERTTI